MPDPQSDPELPRLIATDLDGTLLRSDGSVSPYTRSVLAAVESLGVPVVFVTGRPLRWMDSLWEHVGELGQAIVSNGAVLFDVPARSVLDLRGIDPATGLAIVEEIRFELPDAMFAIECLSGIRVEPGFIDDPSRVPPGSPQGPLSEIWDVEAVKLLVRHQGGVPLDPREHDAFQAAVTAAVGRLATPTWSMPGLAEISAAGVTKAATLARLCDSLGITASQVAAFGDMPNDLPMLDWAGSAYAMEGAVDEVRVVADRSGGHNDEDGVARTLVKLFDLAHVEDPS